MILLSDDRADDSNNPMSDGIDAETDNLFALAYNELHQLAQKYMQSERNDHTLSATALLNEAFVRLAQSSPCQFKDEEHFAATAAVVMRHILINHAKAKSTAKRGGHWQRTHLDALAEQFERRSGDLEALDCALKELEQLDPVQHQLVELRFFGGLTMAQAARVVGLSERSAFYEWSHARAWLRNQLED